MEPYQDFLCFGVAEPVGFGAVREGDVAGGEVLLFGVDGIGFIEAGTEPPDGSGQHLSLSVRWSGMVYSHCISLLVADFVKDLNMAIFTWLPSLAAPAVPRKGAVTKARRPLDTIRCQSDAEDFLLGRGCTGTEDLEDEEHPLQWRELGLGGRRHSGLRCGWKETRYGQRAGRRVNDAQAAVRDQRERERDR